MATVTIEETNGAAPGTATAAITNSNYGSNDSVNLVSASFPIAPSANSYEKWQRWNVTAMGASVSVRNLKYFATAPGAAAVHGFNGHITQGTYDSTKKTVYETPALASTKTPNAVPQSAPASANIGIAGSLTAELTAPGFSDFAVSQIQLSAGATAGTTVTITFRRDEVA